MPSPRTCESVFNGSPALLPKYGGHWIFGHKVHDAMIVAGDKESAYTVHFADDRYS